MARESKVQRIADQKRGRLAEAVDEALLAMYWLGFRHGYEDCRKAMRKGKAKTTEPKESMQREKT